MLRPFRIGLLLALALATLSAPVLADWPPDESQGPVDYSNSTNWPNDPDYGGKWGLWSFLPASVKNKPSVSEQNKRLGSGSHVDRAWAKTTGDRRVLISVLDSGANWSNDDLTNKWYLNRGELPAPDEGCIDGDGVEYDRNGDGYFNVQDYTTATGHTLPTWDTVCDSRIQASGDVNGNNILDPQDLIAAFSDGTDTDDNGYIDDISGWDFFHNDNDPYDDTQYGHGDGESTESSAEGNNGRHGLGTCPDCSVQLLRVGDSFITDANQFALAVLYATDNGGSVVQEALGTIDMTQLARDAIDYAYKNGVAVIASAADENSFHHNMPGTANHTYYVHAITFDAAGGWRNANTFLNFNNCTNYGANLLASAPAANCSSGAVGILSGMAGLVYSAALKADLPSPFATPPAGDPDGVRRLTAEEVYQILSGTSDDLYDPADATDPTRYPTRMGWEQRFGYGRINARSAVDAVLDGKLPPEVELRDPTWFQVVHPERTPMLTIDGRVEIGHAASSDNFDYVLEWAPGVEPNDGDFKTIASGNMVGEAIDGPLGTLDVSQLTIDNPTQGPPDQLTNRRLITLRLRATMHSTANPAREGVKGETRRAIFIEHDPDLLPGFPIYLGTSGEMSGKMLDLDGNGTREFVFADTAGRVHALQADGKELPGWPAKTELLPTLNPDKSQGGHLDALAFQSGAITKDWHAPSAFALAAGDVDGDGKLEVIVASYYGSVWAFKADGSVAPGWPFVIDQSTKTQTDPQHILFEGVLAAPSLADMNGDGQLDVVVATMNSLVYVLGGDGKPLTSWNGGQPLMVWDTSLPDDPHASPRRLRDRIVSSPAIGDLNGDGTPDIVLGTNENYDDVGRLYAIDGKTASYLPGWPVRITSKYLLPMIGSGLPNAPVLADFDGDGKTEVVTSGIAGPGRILDAQGQPWKYGDFGGVFTNSSTHYGPESDATDAITIGIISNPSVGDLDGDGVLDVVLPTAGLDNALGMATGGLRRDAEHHLSAWDSHTGDFKPGFPRHIEDFQFFNSASIADLDDDGKPEIVEGSGGYWVHAWNVDGVEPAGFPKLTGGWITVTPAIGDMDGDGKLDVAVTTRDGWVYAWSTKGRADGCVNWPTFQHDNQNTGNYATVLDQGGDCSSTERPPVTPPSKSSGCSCALGGAGGGPGASGFGGAALLGVSLLGLLALRRRRAR